MSVESDNRVTVHVPWNERVWDFVIGKNPLFIGHTRILEMIATGVPLDETLAELALFIESQEQGLRCGILIVADDGKHVGSGVGPTLLESYYRTLDGAPICQPHLGPCGEAIDRNRAVIVPNIAQDTRWSNEWRDLVLSCGFKSMRSTPVCGSDGRLLASFATYYDRQCDPQPAEPELIKIATHLASIALERDKAKTATDRQAREQEALYKFTDRLYRTDNPVEISEAALDALLSALCCNRAAILRFDEAGVMRFVAARGLSEAYQKAIEGHTPWKPGENDPKPIYIEDIEQADQPESLKATVRAEGIGALAFIPLVANSGTVGKFMTYYDAPHIFTSHETELALTIARQLGFSLERERAEQARRLAAHALEEREQQLADDLRVTRQLQDISTLLIHERGIQALYDKLVEAAAAIMGSKYASMQVLYPESGSGGKLRLLSFRGFNPQAAKFWEWVRADSESTCGVALRTRKRVIAADVSRCDFMAGTEDLETYLQTGIQAVQTTPLLSRSGRLVGMISTHWEKPHDPPERDLRQLDVLARLATDLVERAQAEQAVRQSEERFRALIDASAQIVWAANATGEVIEDSPTWRAFTGQTYEQWKGFGWLDVFHPDDRQRVAQEWRDATSRQIPIETEYRIRHVSGEWRWTTVRAAPILAADGGKGYVGMNTDITARKRAEAMRAAHNSVLELAIQDAPIAHILDTLVRTIEGPSYGDMLGSILLLDGMHLRHGAAPSLPEAYNAAIDGIEIGPGVGSCGTAAYTKKPVHVSDIATDPLWIDFRELALSEGLRACWSTPILAGSGEVLGTFALYYRNVREPSAAELELVTFVTQSAALIIERGRVRGQQTLLLREMDHRIKNLFAVAGGIVSMTARRSADAQDMAHKIRDRLDALARAHSLIRPAIDGNASHSTLRALVETVISPYLDPDPDRGRVIINGSEVAVDADAATGIALVLHEFATNAAKYGALSSPRGRVHIGWSASNNDLSLNWHERDGPTIKGPPASEGFGSVLARQSIERQLGGKISRQWRPEGLIVELIIPLERLTK